MSRAGGAAPLPPAVRRALTPATPRCYRHCTAPVRARRIRSTLPGTVTVYACPGGAVSVTTYAEWSLRDPSPAFRRSLGGRTLPRSLVRAVDLRGATRHGPELGLSAERALRRAASLRSVRVVYWRVYPSKDPDGTERRLFVCYRHGRAGPVFFRAPTDAVRPRCPRCGPGGGAGRRPRA